MKITLDKIHYKVYNHNQKGGEKQEKAQRCWNTEGQKGGDRMYTEYGYTKNGIEYATIEEALEAETEETDNTE